MRGKGRKKQYLYIYTRYNVCCVLIKINYVDFNQPQTRHYEQTILVNKTSIPEKEKEENCKIGKAFQNK